MNIALAFGLCFAAGYLAVSSAWTQEKSNKAEWLMKMFLSAGFGIGIFSVTFFVDRLLGIVHILATDLGLTALLLVVYLLARARRTSGNSIRREFLGIELPSWLHRLLMASFIVSVLAALYASVLRALVHPHGDGWDAFAIWNLHARFFFLGGVHGREGFS